MHTGAGIMKVLLIGMASWMLVANASAFYEKTTTDWYTKENPGNDPFVVHLLDKLEDGWAVMVNEGRIRKRIIPWHRQSFPNRGCPITIWFSFAKLMASGSAEIVH